jgi:hypothetical protein
VEAFMKCGIIIPVYRQFPLESEIVSLKQCCTTLVNFPIIIITYKTLDITEYIKILEEYNIIYRVEYFCQIYFSGISGYNALMVSDKFYKRFLNYEYIFIHQLDVYIFLSNLDSWIEQDYDYIGGPWFDEIRHTQELKWSGYFNGGLCLRRVKFFYDFCFSTPVKISKIYFWNTATRKMQKKVSFKKIYLFVMSILIRTVVKLSSIQIENEDMIWSNIVKQKGKAPSFAMALNFSFSDTYPEYAFELNNNCLPFGCHAWDSYHSYKFWKKHIKIKPVFFR